MAASLLPVVYSVLLLYGVFSDVRFRRVPNVLVLLLLGIGILGTSVGEAQAGSLAQSVLGAALGLAMWLPFWLGGLLGAGDVKYFAAAAAWLGVPLAWRTAVIAALVGGVMSLIVMAWRSGLQHTAEVVSVQAAQARTIIANADVSSSHASARTFPYALPMAVAVFFSSFAPARVLALFGF